MKVFLHLREKTIKEVFEWMSVPSKCLFVKIVGKQHCNQSIQTLLKLMRKCVTNIIKNAVQRIQFISLKTHTEDLILILCYLYTLLQLNQTYSAVRNQQWVTVPAFSGMLRKADSMGPGQRRTLKQAIKRAMKDEVNEVTKKKFKRKKSNCVEPSELLLLHFCPWYLLLLCLAFSLWDSQNLFQDDQLNGVEYGLSLYVFVINFPELLGTFIVFFVGCFFTYLCSSQIWVTKRSERCK